MLPLLLLLVTAPGAPGLTSIDYVPTLTNRTLGGRTTASTFVLEQPRCVFGDAQRGAQIWLVVALAAAADRFDASAAPGTPQLAFQTFPNNTAYATLGTALANYPCPPRPGDITVLRVGSETACRDDPERPSCNGPLPGPGPYRVKFVAWNQSGPQAETQWSEPITLKIGRAPCCRRLPAQRRDWSLLQLWPGLQPSPCARQSRGTAARRDCTHSCTEQSHGVIARGGCTRDCTAGSHGRLHVRLHGMIARAGSVLPGWGSPSGPGPPSFPPVSPPAQQADNLPVMAGGRSTGMIVLTSLLSILFAILLACLVALLATWSSDSCGSGVIFSKPDAVTVKRYNTHHVYDQPAARL
ncbi:uroplakin-3b-like protein 1 [Apteryx mantelli]|uniref:Uroplakin-3b-like protein 1 n=1 Tax=Apteryx mantelli TaxID=2696672 RepID=A0ABM4FM56_9AVES